MSRMIKKDGVWHKTSGNVDYSEINQLKQELAKFNELLSKVSNPVETNINSYFISGGNIGSCNEARIIDYGFVKVLMARLNNVAENNDGWQGLFANLPSNLTPEKYISFTTTPWGYASSSAMHCTLDSNGLSVRGAKKGADYYMYVAWS